jgi:hypothetical protein
MTQAAREERTGPWAPLRPGQKTANPASVREFMSIPPGAIIPGSLPKFRIYLLSPQGQYVLWAEEGNSVSTDRLATLSENGVAEVFVEICTTMKILAAAAIPWAWKG